MKIPKKIEKEIIEYCKINNIKDVDKFIIEQVSVGFNIEKYGNAPFIKEIVVEKEVPVETIKEIVIEKEVPVEVIKEVIKEVPVEKEVIKEIVVEKEVYVSDDKKITDLVEQIESLKGKLIEDTQTDFIEQNTDTVNTPLLQDIKNVELKIEEEKKMG